jgi:hypothetical protein
VCPVSVPPHLQHVGPAEGPDVPADEREAHLDEISETVYGRTNVPSHDQAMIGAVNDQLTYANTCAHLRVRDGRLGNGLKSRLRQGTATVCL